MIQEKINNGKVWFITGASKGFGLTLAKFLLANGDKVAATSRTVTELEKQDADRNEFETWKHITMSTNFDTI